MRVVVAAAEACSRSQSLGVRLAEVMLSRLRRRVERHGARRTVHVAADRIRTTRRKPRPSDVTTR